MFSSILKSRILVAPVNVSSTVTFQLNFPATLHARFFISMTGCNHKKTVTYKYTILADKFTSAWLIKKNEETTSTLYMHCMFVVGNCLPTVRFWSAVVISILPWFAVANCYFLMKQQEIKKNRIWQFVLGLEFKIGSLQILSFKSACF